MTYMPIDEKPVCPWLKCVAGQGLAGSGICFLGGEWDNPECLEFQDEAEFIKKNEKYLEEKEP